VLAVDGKSLRRSHDCLNCLKVLHTVSVWASEYGLSLALVATPETGNEITAIPVVLAQIELNEAIVTIDAIETQKEIAEQIVASGGDYVLALKDNQGKLKENVIEYVTQRFDNLADGQVRRVVMKSRGHGREETREVFWFAAPAELTNSGDWRGLATLGFVKLTTVRAGKTTKQVRYFISSLPLGLKTFARAIRSHWRIENSCHWGLDVTCREDESRTREKCARENFAWLYRFILSLLKQHTSKQSLAMKRRACVRVQHRVPDGSLCGEHDLVCACPGLAEF
jgi:predicted transposase YbfD/YdcC